MLRRYRLWLALLIPMGMLLIGCSGTHSSRARGTPKPELGESSPVSSLRKNGRGEEAALERRAAAHAHYAAAVLHDLNDEPELASQEFQKAALNDPDDETLVLEVSSRFLQLKQPEKALDLLVPAAARPGASGAIFARLGFVYSQLGKNDLAIEANRKAIKKLPRSLAGYQNLFLNYLQVKQPAEALKVLDDAAKLSDADAEFLIGVAGLYSNYALQFPSQREGVQAKALALLIRAQKLRPTSPQLRLKLADGFYLLGDNEHAAQLYLDALKQIGDSPFLRESVRSRLTDIYLRSSDRKRAIEQLEALVRDDPGNAQAYYFLGSIAYDEKRWADAVENYKRALLFNPDFEPAYYDLAGVQIAANQADEALATLDKATRKFARSFIVEYLTGMALSRQKKYPEAINHFTAAEVIAQATETNRLTHTFYFQLGAAFERKGDFAAAEKYFEKALQLSPEFADALNYLGYMWADRGTNLDRAKELIEKAVKLEPENAAFLDSLGWVLFKLNQPKEALDYILKAVKLNEEPDATLFDHLGDVYAALKETSKAREAWQKSLSVEHNDQVQKKLEPPKSD